MEISFFEGGAGE